MPLTTIPPKKLRRNKVQAFLTDDDFAALSRIARSCGENPGSLAGRVLATFAQDCAHLADAPSAGAAE